MTSIAADGPASGRRWPADPERRPISLRRRPRSGFGLELSAARNACFSEPGGQRHHVYMNQVHGDVVAVVDEMPTFWPVADALVTRARGLPLVVRTADCVPVLLVDVEAGVAAVVHAGRAGVVNGVVTATLASMVALGADPGRTRAWIGPSICGGCYEVGEVLQREVSAVEPAAASATRWGTAGVDCAAGVVQQLGRGGIGDVRTSPFCTFESGGLSYRRDRTTMRNESTIWLGDARTGAAW